MVISHPNATHTTFVMPNAYCESEEYFADGESMGDWYTGSGTVLMKEIMRRRMYLGEQELTLFHDAISNTDFAVISREQLGECAVITVLDDSTD